MAVNAPNGRPGRYMVPAPTADEWSKLSDFEKDRKRGQEWLKRSYGWEINADKLAGQSKWIGDKVLGKGCAVIKKGTYVKGNYIYERFVVKQASSPQAKASMQNGAYISKCLGEEALNHKPEHIVTPIGGYKEDAGTGTDDTFDPVYVHDFAPDTVARIYTPYYEGGNFQQWLDENYSSEYPSENDVWSVMECLARICMNLEHGYEARGLRADRKAFQPIAHLDIRPQSIFCNRSDLRTDGQHAIRTKFSLGKFEKAVHVPSDPTDKKWMFRVHGRADPKWAAPEQKYPQMEGRSISSSCNVFGIGALLYYMIKGKEIDDRAWRIGMPGSASNPEVKLCFGGDLITEPVAKQQEYSKALIRVILECLAYLPSDRITAANLRDVSARATEKASRPWLYSETQYTPGDPATIFQPQEELQPNDYTVEDLTLRDKIPVYNPPRDHPETLRARAEKWLSNFWLFPDSTKSQEARDKQREMYEREVEKQRQEAEAAEAKKQATIKARAEIHATFRLAEKAEEAARIQLQQDLAKARAKAIQSLAELDSEEAEQILLPQPNNKRDRSPEPPQETEKRVRFNPSLVTEGRESPTRGILKSILKPSEKDKGRETVGVPNILVSKELGVSTQAGSASLPSPSIGSGNIAQGKATFQSELPITFGDNTATSVSAPSVSAPSVPAPLLPALSGQASLPKSPVVSGNTAQAKPVSVAKPPITSGNIIPSGQAPSGLAPSSPAPSGTTSLTKPPQTSGAPAQARPNPSDYRAEERRKINDEANRMTAEERADEAKWEREVSEYQSRREEEKRRKEQEEEGRERQAEADEEAEKASKVLEPPIGGASRALSSNVDVPSMRRRRESSPEPWGPSRIHSDIDNDNNNNNGDDDDSVEEVTCTGSRARSLPRPKPPGGDPANWPALGGVPERFQEGMQAEQSKTLYCSLCGKAYELRSYLERHIENFHWGRHAVIVRQKPPNPEAQPAKPSKPVQKKKKGKAPAKRAKKPAARGAKKRAAEDAKELTDAEVLEFLNEEF
ncbi:163185ac-775c-4048-b306-ccae59ca0c15 [Sclerotinia trifoliorum]|uniref:163185ac-775c-4048-b306-ccae59ca0c15 n=1 Tax=Sclerotinia trifoliorum TaxID=28548 RepID=A0A8H2VW23_9HELO|nr:163185ac-775c-4048-b306-ccae59ca0c15 [Sclerotinia trifoliorum]